MCAAPPRCRLCRGNHKTAQHLWPALNCLGGQGEVCEHTVRICMLCESSGHFTGYDWCPALRATPETAPPLTQGSPIAGDAGAVSGIADRNRNRFNTRSRNRRRPTPPGEMAVNEADEGRLMRPMRHSTGCRRARLLLSPRMSMRPLLPLRPFSGSPLPTPTSKPPPVRPGNEGGHCDLKCGEGEVESSTRV